MKIWCLEQQKTEKVDRVSWYGIPGIRNEDTRATTQTVTMNLKVTWVGKGRRHKNYLCSWEGSAYPSISEHSQKTS